MAGCYAAEVAAAADHEGQWISMLHENPQLAMDKQWMAELAQRSRRRSLAIQRYHAFLKDSDPGGQ